MDPVKENSGSKTVFDMILEWSKKCPAWQKDALRRIVSTGKLTDKDFEELLDICKGEHGGDISNLAIEPLSAEHLPAAADAGKSLSLVSISDVAGVNQLAPGQTLSFESSGITIIYGQNGTGKSGYSRILKRACRARHRGEIIPNIHSSDREIKATAKLSVVSDNGESETLNWKDSKVAIEKLSTITVFDRECATEHIQDGHGVWFRPFGLDIPDDLAKACDILKQKIEQEENALKLQKNDIFINQIWSPNTTIGKILSNLTYNTDINIIKSLPELSKVEKARLSELRNILDKDPTIAAKEQQEKANDLKQAISYLRKIFDGCCDKNLDEIFSLATVAKNKREAARAAASSAFGDVEISGVGESVWQSLWESARAYSNSLEGDSHQFPPILGDFCVLCHQQIDTEAANKMAKFEEFVKGHTEVKAKEAIRKCNIAVEALTDLPIEISKVSSVLHILRNTHDEIAGSIKKFLAMARLRRFQTIKDLWNDQKKPRMAEGTPPISEIESVILTAENYAGSLIGEKANITRKNLESEKNELVDKEQAKSLIQTAELEIERQKQLNILAKCKGDMSTRPISLLGGRIADEIITAKLHDRFEEEISELAGNDLSVKVEFNKSGSKSGIPNYQVKLSADSTTRVHDILSEGEQTCVALAAYLAELATAEHNSALIFDDPVTSLDHKWRAKVAERLVKESAIRQIVIFTHDRVFINDIFELAEEHNVPANGSLLYRTKTAVGFVKDELPRRTAQVKQRIAELEKKVMDAREVNENGTSEEYHAIVGEFYNDLRTTWERTLESVAFANVINRYRDQITIRNLDKVTALSKSDVVTIKLGFKKCHRHITGHDASDAHDIQPPDPDQLDKDVMAIKDWVTDFNNRAKKAEA